MTYILLRPLSGMRSLRAVSRARLCQWRADVQLVERLRRRLRILLVQLSQLMVRMHRLRQTEQSRARSTLFTHRQRRQPH